MTPQEAKAGAMARMLARHGSHLAFRELRAGAEYGEKIIAQARTRPVKERIAELTVDAAPFNAAGRRLDAGAWWTTADGAAAAIFRQVSRHGTNSESVPVYFRAPGMQSYVALALSREVGGLSDPRPGKGEPVPVEVSGAHLLGGSTLTIAPQATWIFRGSVASGVSVSIAGDSTAYATAAAATVDDTAPDTLGLSITPGLAGALAGGEVVTLGEAASVSYPLAWKESDEVAASRGWAVPSGSAVFAVYHEGQRAPEPGDIASGGFAGSVLRLDNSGEGWSLIQIGGVA